MTSVVESKKAASKLSQWTTYEFPLNERIRTLLRLEDLFKKFSFFISQDHKLDHHAALLTLFEIIEVGSRADLKSDLLQELERQKTGLNRFLDHPGVDNKKLDETLVEIDRVLLNLNTYSGKLGQHLRSNEFLMAIRSRCSIPGGVCEFDLPSYHRWQSMAAQKRREDAEKWFAPMAPLAKAIELVLTILRDSGELIDAVATDAAFTQQMTGKSYQLLRADIPVELNAVPEFSANKYMLWVRFNQPNEIGVCKNNPYNEPFDFKIRFCYL